MAAVSPSTILAVDDDDINLKMLVFMLDDFGYKVRTATCGSEALESVAKQPPDLVVLDVMMPGLDGFEVLQLLKADAKTEKIPVVMLTALSDDASRRRALKLGASRFFTKPADRREVETALRDLLKRGSAA